MSIKIDQKKVEELLLRGVDEVIDINNLKNKLLSGRRLRIKLGIDPTSPNLHLGRAVTLLKLKDFQLLRHKLVLIVGDFTGIIGDTSDKESERPMLTEATVHKNMKTYVAQAGVLLDIDKVEIHYNSHWLKKLNYTEIGLQADQFSLAEFMARENIKRRFIAGKRISLRELLYPLMQGYDSVAVKADVEIGGTDQRFNLLAGRTMQTFYQQRPQDILMTNLILGTDGRKMSSSWANTINLMDEPQEMFGKIMSIGDNQIISYFEHCTRVSMGKIKEYQKQLAAGKVNPKDIKTELAYEITKLYWKEIGARKGRDHFVSVFQKKSLPKDLPKIKFAGKNIVDVLLSAKLVKSKSEARRLIKEKGVKVDGQVIQSAEEIVKKGRVVQKGKRHFVKII
ncbi:tyrosine--tRNA ligase [Patescibacteria group bacterium]|nr:tyrosine--tRNA ligase [Patescibacteria group bacterium]